ncbi:hypothetical protein CC80DRAFT_541961 [Byssothecium circinans]|uniref:Uncharacterized protein n=1 Tax=Byssothecium circinans TaxID=147558 RepID=A0A6A5UD19_9PLEO|nr:hypothetical protein CC80DRAFT_541961 [Byssothecium circinans]
MTAPQKHSGAFAHARSEGESEGDETMVDSIEGDVGAVELQADTPGLPKDTSLLLATEDEWLAANHKVKARHDYTITDIDDRLPYRQGWPVLPVLPVTTKRGNIPKALSASSEHVANMTQIVELHKLPFQNIEVVHRHNPTLPISKSTLTLCILANSSTSSTTAHWAPTIRALRSYITSQTSAVTLAIEIIDARIFSGIFTLPILAFETALAKTVAKKRRGVANILDDAGVEWTSLEFWWRGLESPQRSVWWCEGGVLDAVRKKMGGVWKVELCWRKVVKY